MHRVRLSRWICTFSLLALYGCSSSQSRNDTGAAVNSDSPVAEQAPAPKEQAPPILVPAGTTLSVTVDPPVSSKNRDPAQRVVASLAEPITIDGRAVIRRGANLTGKGT